MSEQQDDRLHPDPIVRLTYFVRRCEAAESEVVQLRNTVDIAMADLRHFEQGLAALVAKWDAQAASERHDVRARVDEHVAELRALQWGKAP